MSARPAVALVLAVLVTSLVTARPGAAETAKPLPATVRVNVANLGIGVSVFGLGNAVARFGSAGTLVVTNNEVTEVYRGRGEVVARLHVLRARDGRKLADRLFRIPTGDPVERRERLLELADARIAEREGGDARVRMVGFELAAVTGSDVVGRTLLAADRPALVTFTSSDGIVAFQGTPFLGKLELAFDDEDDLIAVNTVPTFDYLASVVGSEIVDSWHDEAMAAQAIAARTYLATRLGRHRAYDIEGDTRDQAYGGTAKVTERTRGAVARTRGIMATYEGAPIEALYSASAGGLTEDAENAFGTSYPYLRSVPSPWDAEALNVSWGRTSWAWTEEVGADELGWKLARKGFDVGKPTQVEVVEVSPTGRVLQVHVAGTTGTREIRKDRSRFAFDLMSTLFTVTKTGDTFMFTGKGFGHGVGMSQWGMQGLALEGKSASEILSYYYRGIALTDTGGP